MTNWRTILGTQEERLTHPQYPQNPQNRSVEGVFEDIEDFEDRKLTETAGSQPLPGDGPCPQCGSRLWFRSQVNVGPWQCRHCVEPGSDGWKELLYAPEGWRPLKAGEPGLALTCPRCHRAVSTLIHHKPGEWRCSDCCGIPAPDWRL